jgi:hypothetical protein
MEATLEMPNEFKRLSRYFIQDRYDWGVEHYPEWIKEALELTHYPPNRVQKLKDYLDYLLSLEGDKPLEDAWQATAPGFYRSGPGAMRRFFTQIRETLDTVKITFLPIDVK